MNPCTIYSDHALSCIIRDLSRSGQWPQRLKLAIAEEKRRKLEDLTPNPPEK